MNRDDSVAAVKASPLCIVECNVFVLLDATPVSMESEHNADCPHMFTSRYNHPTASKV